MPKQAKDTIINIPPPPPKAPKRQGQAADNGGRQSLGAAVWWGALTGVGLIWLAAVLLLCAWPIVHFIAEAGLHTSMVRAAAGMALACMHACFLAAAQHLPL